jgi:glycosyltransferase involved in cell wall biosynthesis
VLRVIVVDDGSTDNTAEIAKLAGAKVISHSQNEGKGYALRTGFEAAWDADIIVTLDGDGQHNPEEIPQILEPILDNKADMVIGSRYINGNGKDTPLHRRLGQNVLDTTTNISGGVNISDSQSGFRAFNKVSFPAFNFHHTDFSIESEMVIEAGKADLRIIEVEISAIYGSENDHTKGPVSHGVGVLIRLLQDMEFNRPLYYFTLPGMILIIFGLIYGFYAFGEYLGGATKTLAPTTLAALITLIGTFIGFTGIILHSISRMIRRELRR